MDEIKISDRAIENILTGESDPQLEILRRIAENKSVNPEIRYLAASCRKFQLDEYKRSAEAINEREMSEYE